jgi:SAM-dependent methyltransferase
VNDTLNYYEENAVELSASYEGAQLDMLYQAMSSHFPAGSSLLEIGCGSGRDAARLLAAGYGVQAVDGSENLLAEALKLHPELVARTHHVLLPATLPFAAAGFDGFYSVACLMHFSGGQIAEILNEARRVLKPAGRGLVSVPTRRADINNDGIDQHGRTFKLFSPAEWLEIFTKCGFSAKAGKEEPDGAGREGISWISYFLTKI